MAANKLQQLKNKLLLLQKQKTYQQKSILASILVEAPSSLPIVPQISDNKDSIIKAIQAKKVSESMEEDPIQSKKNIQQRQEANQIVIGNTEPIQSLAYEDQQQQLEDGEEGEEKQKSVSQNSHKKESIFVQANKSTIIEKPSGMSENFQLFKQPNISVSIDQEVRQTISQKITEIKNKNQTEEHLTQSKVEKKTKKIILKQLIKAKQSVKNMQEAINGLMYIQQKIKNHPHLQQRISNYNLCLKNIK